MISLFRKSAVEYGLVAASIAVAIIVTMATFGDPAQPLYGSYSISAH